MNVTVHGRTRHYRTVTFDTHANSVRLIEQRLLPHQFKIVATRDFRATAKAIQEMVVRGAGAIGAHGERNIDALGVLSCVRGPHLPCQRVQERPSRGRRLRGRRSRDDLSCAERAPSGTLSTWAPRITARAKCTQHQPTHCWCTTASRFALNASTHC